MEDQVPPSSNPIWERLTVAAMVLLGALEAMVLFPSNIGPAFISDWPKNVDGSNLALLPPALIGLLIAYGKWAQQQRAVEVGTVLVAAIAPVAAMSVIEIDDGPTFWMVLVCIGITALAVGRHVPWNSRLNRANVVLVCFGVCGAIALNVPEAIEPDEVEKAIRRIFTWATMVLFILVAVFYFFVNVRRSLAWGAYVVISTGTVLALWVFVLEGVHTRYPVVGSALVYALVALLGFAPAGYALVKDRLTKASGLGQR